LTVPVASVSVVPVPANGPNGKGVGLHDRVLRPRIPHRHEEADKVTKALKGQAGGVVTAATTMRRGR